jgi:hypothetical protein
VIANRHLEQISVLLRSTLVKAVATTNMGGRTDWSEVRMKHRSHLREASMWCRSHLKAAFLGLRLRNDFGNRLLSTRRSESAMQLCFQNNYSSPLWVAVMWWNPDSCGGDGGNWSTEGWWNLNPGDNVNTGVGTNNRYFYFYAEAEDGAVWGGDYGPVDATYQAFQGCVGIGSSRDNLSIGMRQEDAGWWVWAYFSYTVNLD